MIYIQSSLVTGGQMQTGDSVSLTSFLSNQQTKHMKHGIMTKKAGCPDSTIYLRRSKCDTNWTIWSM